MFWQKDTRVLLVSHSKVKLNIKVKSFVTLTNYARTSKHAHAKTIKGKNKNVIGIGYASYKVKFHRRGSFNFGMQDQ